MNKKFQSAYYAWWCIKNSTYAPVHLLAVFIKSTYRFLALFDSLNEIRFRDTFSRHADQHDRINFWNCPLNADLIIWLIFNRTFKTKKRDFTPTEFRDNYIGKKDNCVSMRRDIYIFVAPQMLVPYTRYTVSGRLPPYVHRPIQRNQADLERFFHWRETT